MTRQPRRIVLTRRGRLAAIIGGAVLYAALLGLLIAGTWTWLAVAPW
jgi:hypothetical protein